MKIFGLQIKLNISYKKVVNGLFQSAEYQNVTLEMESSISSSVKKSTKRILKYHISILGKTKQKQKKIMFFSSDTHSVSQSIGLYGK